MNNFKDYYFGDYDNPIRLLLLKLIKDGEWLLDLGCGNGMAYEMLMKNKRQVFYKGIDYSGETIKHILDRWPRMTCFEKEDIRNLKNWPRKYDQAKEYDTVYLRHCLENVEDWQDTIRQAFRLAKKRVIIDNRRKFIDEQSKMVQFDGDTVCWDLNYDEFNVFCRNLTVNVSYLLSKDDEFIGDSSSFVVLGKKLDDVVFTLDDFHETNHRLDLLLKLKEQFPKMKVTLFTIPSKCSVEWLKNLKEKYGEWMEFAVHGWFHDISNRTIDANLYPEECLNWTKEQANRYLQMAEEMGVFVKGFKAPGWGINRETYEVLAERGYWIMEHKDHERYEDIKLPRYTTGSLWEINGHIQLCNFNGLEELVTTKCNFNKDSNFYFVEDILKRKDIYLNNLLCL